MVPRKGCVKIAFQNSLQKSLAFLECPHLDEKVFDGAGMFDVDHYCVWRPSCKELGS